MNLVYLVVATIAYNHCLVKRAYGRYDTLEAAYARCKELQPAIFGIHVEVWDD